MACKETKGRYNPLKSRRRIRAMDHIVAKMTMSFRSSHRNQRQIMLAQNATKGRKNSQMKYMATVLFK
jgi:hypothetical protein